MDNRIIPFDILKSFAIFLVVLGHCIQNYAYSSSVCVWINEYLILPFHMPIFAIISGYFFSLNRSFIDTFKNKFKRLIIPLLFWSFVQLCIMMYNKYFVSDYNDSFHLFSELRNFWYCISDWCYWYLRAIFFCFILSSLIVEWSKSRVVIGGIISIILLYTISFLGIIPNKIPLLQGFIFLYPFFWIGIIYKMMESYLQQYRWHVIIFCFVLLFVLFPHWRGYDSTFYEMNTSIFAGEGSFRGIDVLYQTILRIGLGTSISIIIILLFSLFEDFRFPASVGKYTLGIYVTHVFFLDLPINFLNYGSIQTLILMFLLSLIITCICYYISKILSRTKIGSLTISYKH